MNLTDPQQLASAVTNAYDILLRGGVADLRPTTASIIEEAPQCTVFRYRRSQETTARALPVLLVPPLAAPAYCFDLRRGCSLAEHLIALGHETYLVDYGKIGFSDRDLGLEHWVTETPAARSSWWAGAWAASCRCSPPPPRAAWPSTRWP